MQFSVTFRHMDATDALKGYAKDRLEKIRKYFPEPISIHVVLSTERFHHRVDVNVQLHNGFKIAGTETTENMYSSIDLVSAKIERQVRRYKDKLRAHKVRELEGVAVVHTVLAEPSEMVPADASNGGGEHAGAGDQAALPVVITRETVQAEPMSAAEAIMQLNLLHAPFLVFRNDQTGQINVVYKREDGAYLLIETTAFS
ncbi:MAG TPA: ribosome-associated translation inhibitor RaiA [Kofleriaceae bacterium]|nr:ribosome-associated translation inhibitor RaiA [Kofleriaceae bacterium]